MHFPIAEYLACKILCYIGGFTEHCYAEIGGQTAVSFDLDKSRQKFHHSLKEHHKISNIPKFRCEMRIIYSSPAKFAIFSHFVLQTGN